MEAYLTGEGPTRDADEALCLVVGRDLTEQFPGYAWNVGCDHNAGVIAIRLAVPQFGGMASPGFLMYISTAIGPNGRDKVRAAGGELLERWRMSREKAPDDWVRRAEDNGLDRSHMIEKSKH